MKALVLAATLASQPYCDERATMLEHMQTFGEKQQSIALSSTGTMLEIYVSPVGTWTALITGATGTSRILMMGTAFETVRDPRPPNL